MPKPPISPDITAENAYQPFPDSIFATPFWDFYKVFWEAEARFNLVFRQDDGVSVWPANRVRFYYEIAAQLGLYERQRPEKATLSSPEEIRLEAAELSPVDVFVQTGATGPATENRVRSVGCIYTEPTVRRLLDRGARVLLLCDAPDRIQQHSRLQVITSGEYRELMKRADRQSHPRTVLDEAAVDYWAQVNQFFMDKLGVNFCGPDRIAELITSHRRSFARTAAFLEPLSPKAMICIAHYFRSAQVAAAQFLGVRVIDLQHGINSRYHLGYGYPNVRPEQRRIPYFPGEFWTWGGIWAESEWFPEVSCKTRALGHDNPMAFEAKTEGPEFFARDAKKILVATSWAMRSVFREVIGKIATTKPDWNILVKLHPRESLEDYNDLALTYPNVRIMPGTVDILDAASQVRFVLSICSSSLFDVLKVGCRIAVLNAPAVEYTEDFVRKFDVPVLRYDAKNFDAVLLSMQKQRIPLDRVFHTANGTEWNAALDRILPTNLRSWRAAVRRILMKSARSWVSGWLHRI